jgi:integrase
MQKYPDPYLPKGKTNYEVTFWVSGQKFKRSTGTPNFAKAKKEVERLVNDEVSRMKEDADITESLELQHVKVRYMKLVGGNHADPEHTEYQLDKMISFPSFGPTKDMRDIRHEDVLALRAWRMQDTVGKYDPRPIAPATVNDTIEVLKKLFTFVKKSGVRFEHEPDWSSRTASKVWLDVVEEHVRELADDEAARLESAIETERSDLWPLIEYARHVASRKTNCFELQWKQVIWPRGVIEIIGKGGKRIVIEIDDVLRDILEPLIGHHRDYVFTRVSQRTFDKVVKGKRYTEVKGDRHPWNKDSLRRAWDTVRAAAGLKGGDDNLRFHDLRHDFASKALRAAPDATGIKVVQKALGHHSAGFTLNVYGHLLENAVPDMRGKLAEQRAARRKNHSPHHSPTKLKVV